MAGWINVDDTETPTWDERTAPLAVSNVVQLAGRLNRSPNHVIPGAGRYTRPRATADIIDFPAGRWNCDQHGELRRTVAKGLNKAAAARPGLADLGDLLLPRIPGMVRVSDNIKGVGGQPTSWVEPIRYAVGRPWIAFNNDRFVNAITIDCDHDDMDLVDGLVWKSDLAPPLIVSDMATGRYHATWLLSAPVHVYAGAARKPQRALALARALLTTALKGDPAYNNSLTKNPFARKNSLTGPLKRKANALYDESVVAAWEAQTFLWGVDDRGMRPCELTDIIKCLRDDYEPSWPGRKNIKLVRNSEGRNTTLFDTIREWSYKHYDTYYGDFFAELLRVARQVNSEFERPLKDGEVYSTAKSVHKFMRTKWNGRKRERNANLGVMTKQMIINQSMTLTEKQKAAGAWSRRTVRDKTDRLIHEACIHFRNLRPGSEKMCTQKEIAEFTGLSLSTVKNRWAEVKKVQHGRHQIIPTESPSGMKQAGFINEACSLENKGQPEPENDIYRNPGVYNDGVGHHLAVVLNLLDVGSGTAISKLPDIYDRKGTCYISDSHVDSVIINLTDIRSKRESKCCSDIRRYLWQHQVDNDEEENESDCLVKSNYAV